MFRVFGRFNALFVRPKIRGAIQEWQTQLIDSVKEDIRRLQDKFMSSYRVSSLHLSIDIADLHSYSTLKPTTLLSFVIFRQSRVLSSGPSRLKSNFMPICDVSKMCWAKAGSSTPKAKSYKARAQVSVASLTLDPSTKLGCTKSPEETFTSLVDFLKLLATDRKLVNCNWASILILKSSRGLNFSALNLQG